jgi:hypothetical protein
MTTSKTQSSSILQKAIKSAGDLLVGAKADWNPVDISDMKTLSLGAAAVVAAADMVVAAAENVVSHVVGTESHGDGILLTGAVLASIAAVSAPRLAMRNRTRAHAKRERRSALGS